VANTQPALPAPTQNKSPYFIIAMGLNVSIFGMKVFSSTFIYLCLLFEEFHVRLGRVFAITIKNCF
jgi:hypothetical protein